MGKVLMALFSFMLYLNASTENIEVEKSVFESTQNKKRKHSR